ncbi:MAG: hypothetical protein WAT89_07050 [Candidatus Kapaibacterium sp.]
MIDLFDKTLFLFAADMEFDAAMDNKNNSYNSAICGVGLVNSAIGTAKAIQQKNPEKVIFIGSCGSYNKDFIQEYDFVIGESIKIASSDLLLGNMRVPALIQSEFKTNENLNNQLLDFYRITNNLKKVNIATTFGITESEKVAKEFENYFSCEVENLEAYSVAQTCIEFNIPFSIILGVTNIVDKNGGTNWYKNYKNVLKELFKPFSTN